MRQKPFRFFSRAAMLLLMMLLTTASAWGQEAITGLNYNSTGGYYEINDEQDLFDLATYVNAGNDTSGKIFKQTKPITMTGSNFTPIAGTSNQNLSFNGTYDGGKFAITGLHVDISSSAYAGLFGNVEDGTIRNVTLVSPYVRCSYAFINLGAVVGSLSTNSTIEDCYVVKPTLVAASTRLSIGAIVGKSVYYQNAITNCYFYDNDAGHNYKALGAGSIGITTNVGRAYALTFKDNVTTSTAAKFSDGENSYYTGTVALCSTARLGCVFNGFTVNGKAISDTTFNISSDATIAATYIDMFGMDDGADGTATHPYIISNEDGWNFFCEALQDNDTYNRFSGKTVKLGADIGTAQNPITRMAGTSKHDFCGTFDGNSKTLTVNISSDKDHDYTAPFSYISETTPIGNEVSHPVIRNLNVAGTITATKDYAGGIVGAFWGTLTIENCTSSVTINTDNKHAAGFISNARGDVTITNCLSSGTITGTISGDGTHAGFIGGSASGVKTTITGCAFTGSLIGDATTHCAGFVGYNSGTLTITHSLFAPTSVSVGDTGSATFARGNEPTLTNSYYTAALGTLQGKAAHSIKTGEGVSVGHAGEAKTYSVSSIKVYKATDANGDSDPFIDGIVYNDVLYAGADEEVSLTISNSGDDAPLGYNYLYTASDGTLSGNATDGYTLQMPDDDVTVSAAIRSDGQSYSISFIRSNGARSKQPAIALDETMTNLNAGWYFVGKDINYTQTVNISGTAYIILTDGKTMNVGTSESPISGHCIEGSTKTLTILGQSDQSGTLNAYSNSDAVNLKNYSQYGGNVNAIAGKTLIMTGNFNFYYDLLYAFAVKNFTISGGNLNATGKLTATGNFTMSGGTATVAGLLGTSGLNFSGGNLTANGGFYGDATLSWTRANDRFYASSYDDGDNITIAPGQIFTDGNGHYYTGTLNSDDKTAIASKTLTPFVTTGVTLATVEKDLTATFDGTSLETVNIPAPIEVDAVALKRSFTAGKASTIMLPFDYTCNAEADGGEFYDFVGVEKDEETNQWVATMQKVDELTANTPYMYMAAKDIDGITFTLPEKVTLNTTKGGECQKADKGSHWTFNGTYSYMKWTSDTEDWHYTKERADEIGKVYGFAGEKKDGIDLGDFVKVESGAQIRPMTCYLIWNNTPNSTRGMTRAAGDDLPQSITVRFIGANGETTAIGTLNTQTGEITTDGWYTLSGTRLPSKPSQRGIYINNGRKVVIH